MHIMIDLETLGLKPNTVVTQIGWAAFAFDDKECHGAGLIHLDVQSQLNRGRSVDWSTIAWWFVQEEAARKAMATTGRADVLEGCISFITHIAETFGWSNIDGVWSNGPSFDQTILEDLFYNFDIKTPWKYNAGRDVRTMITLTPNLSKVKPLVAHNAMSDAIAQALYVQHSYHSLEVISNANG